DQFYAEVFPTLQAHTSARPAVPGLIESLAARPARLVLATNPLFPRTAIEQRLVWAGSQLAEPTFARIACMEECHFTKPRPDYFSELLAAFGWPEGPVVIVGDDPLNDLEPAAALGIPAFHAASAAHPTG